MHCRCIHLYIQELYDQDGSLSPCNDNGLMSLRFLRKLQGQGQAMKPHMEETASTIARLVISIIVHCSVLILLRFMYTRLTAPAVLSVLSVMLDIDN